MTALIPVDANALADIALFAALPPAVLDEAAAMARARPLPRGLRVFDQGETAGRAHALLSGWVRITQAGSDGEEILVRFIGPGEIFGCVPVLTDGLYPADATAIVDAVELSWDPSDLLALMQRHSQVAITMVAIVGRRLGEAQERLRELATQSADRRVARTLLRLLDQAGRPGGEGIRIAFPLRRKDVADIAGTTLHTASRILAEWERRGLLVSRNRHLIIASPEELRRISEG
ncbi:Crp/Fnr family transcriptional regulator [Sphingopyxis sp. GW247-27LB]|uniref:Crp/Fnr family transcriptional regulator n=1 Tax=Sphingopyxis sp. GW247-27LB TaxID=2012632 RepID=UPI000BA61BF4|nr:Crp/Fnr family transcriptional regulator [Sphingopyxis sp. GW247-27LB]PAL22291.1 cyclic nucleotide-binding protein [Sphingopyxis sp. GW247-27LB]